ncbi:MAG TPA: response regulator [Clostridia bacterium]|nr:response regulator [Clostridia bacterium]
MYRVILIDNEPWILQGMTVLIPWQSHGFAVAGAYTDPVTAFKAIVRDPPDLVVVDIRMPEMDGLTLIHKAREQGVNCAFVVVSGYADFEYARKAMAGHALDYLLKPVEPEDMGKILKNLADALSGDRTKQSREAALLRSEKDFRALLGNAAEGARFAALRARRSDPKALAALLGGHPEVRHRLFSHGDDGAVALCAGDAGLGESLRAASADWIRERPDARVGMSAVKTDPLSLAEALAEAEAASLQAFLDPGATFTRYRATRTEALSKLAQEIFLYFALRQDENLARAIRKLPDLARKEGACMDGVAGFWNRLAALVNVERAGDSAWREMRSVTPESLAHEFRDIQDLCDGLIGRLGGMVRACCAVPRAGDADARFFDLLEEISARYDEKLELNDLARRHRLNISYCCKLFKRVMGGTFSNYLIALRMERARHAMHATGLPASRVYDRVGYTDYYYFRRSYLKFFKDLPGEDV